MPVIDYASSGDVRRYVIEATAGLLLLYTIYRAFIYRLFLHPLAKYPGPKIAAITDLWYAQAWISGYWPRKMTALQKKYGDVVRIAPNELLFFTARSFKDVHGHANKGHRPFVKAKVFYQNDLSPNVVSTTDVADHRMQRQSLAHAFSAKSLRAQEDIVHHYVDIFIEQLGRLATGPKGVEICEAFNWVTFDIIGDLTFGESFGALEKFETHPWVESVLSGSYFGTIIGLQQRVPILKPFLPFIIPRSVIREFKKHRGSTKERMEKRIRKTDGTDRADFFDYILKKGNYNSELLWSQADILMIAGSETTATVLSSVMWHLSKNPGPLAKLQHEVRTTFSSPTAITGDSTANLAYLSGVVKEGMRIYPPVPFGFPRVSPGAVVDGRFIPEGVLVGTDTFFLQHDPRNWNDPEAFKPERWVGEGFVGDDREAFYPFSLGPRVCLGINLAYLEMRTILAKMVWHYDWELINKDVDLLRDSVYHALWKKPEMNVRFTPRKA